MARVILRLLCSWLPAVLLIRVGAQQYTALDIATGQHVCVILSDGMLKCWGPNSEYQLGYGDQTVRSVMGDALPTVDLGTGRSAQRLPDSMYQTTFVILDDGSLIGFGQNSNLSSPLVKL